MRKIIVSWWMAIVIVMFTLFIMNDLHVKLNLKFEGKEYMKKIGENINPMIENIKIHADGKEYEVVIIDGEFKNKRLDNEEFNLKNRIFKGRAVINYYILKKGCEPLDKDYNKWCLYSIIPVKRDSIFSEYHIDGKAINENIFYHSIYYNFIWYFLDDYLVDSNKERYTGWDMRDFKIEDKKRESNIVFTEDGEVDVEGELLLSYIAIYKGEKIKVTARLVIKSLKGDKDLYITTERM